MASLFDGFVNKYPVSKTLRFELIPEGATLENLEKNGVLSNDEKRNEDYKKLKILLDEYYRAYIERALSNVELTGLEEYARIYNIKNKSIDENKAFEKIQKELREQIVGFLSVEKKKKDLFQAPVIKKELPIFLAGRNDDLRLVESFKGFTTMCTGFFSNRENIFSKEEKSTAIAYRVIHENLPKFMNNMKIYNEQISGKLEVSDEILNMVDIDSVDEMFSLGYFSKTLSQSGIEKYNAVLGGISIDDKTKLQGMNERINLHNQQNSEEKIAMMQPLYKQILSDNNHLSFISEVFESDNDVIDSIRIVYDYFENQILHDTDSMANLITNIKKYNLDGIYIKNDKSVKELSNNLFGDWNRIIRGFNDWYDDNYIGKNRSEEKYMEERRAYFKKCDSFSLKYITDTLKEDPAEMIAEAMEKKIIAVKESYQAAEFLIRNDYNPEKNLIADGDAITKLKALLDAMKELEGFVRLFTGSGKEPDRDELFYGEFSKHLESLDYLDSVYNKTRNYLTRKPYKTEKIKLMFDTAELLSGWDVNREEANKGIILRKDGFYYIGIMDKKDNKAFRDLKGDDNADSYEKLFYKQVTGFARYIPKCSVGRTEVKKHFAENSDDYYLKNEHYDKPFKISKEIYELYSTEYEGKKKFQKDYLRKTGDSEGYEEALKTWISFCMDFLSSYDSCKMFDFSGIPPVTEYKSSDEFYNELDMRSYKIWFENVSTAYINSLVSEGRLYLFKIYNKDFSPYSKGKPNLHTMYWKALFSKENMQSNVYKLNGGAEVFYRKKSILDDQRIIHYAGVPVDNKNELSDKIQSIFGYDIIKNKRYTMDKFQFHVPMTMYCTATGRSHINSEMRKAIKNTEDMHIIGIDRGERHLLYVTVIDLQGNIKEQYSLNEIINIYNGHTYRTNYRSLLDKREKERLDARLQWKSIESIKELKDGYMSQAVHVITQLMLKYNAIVVMEDLNYGFKRGRQKVEKQVYQKFEKALIDKLNYLVDKSIPENEPAGLFRAMQLTEKFTSFKEIGKQNGAVFYVDAWNTSKIDPTTGFVNLLNVKYESMTKSIAFIEKLKDIRLCDDDNEYGRYFKISFDYNDFTGKVAGTKTNWTICSYGTRISHKHNKDGYWEDEEINLTDEFMSLFKKYNIDVEGDIKFQILSQESKEFFKSFMWLLKMTLQIRNSETNGEKDYMISPVKNKEGRFFNTNEVKDGTLPENADANGAYNIARKGLWLVALFKQTPDEELDKVKITISNKDWLKFAQE